MIMGMVISPVLGFWGAMSLFAAASDQGPVRSEGALHFYLDTASFRGAGGKTSQEFYCQIPLEQLTFHAGTSGQQCELKTSVALTDSAGRQLLRDEWMQTVQVGFAAVIAGSFFPTQFDLPLAPGSYQLALTLTESQTNKTGTAMLPFQVARLDRPELLLSGLQFSSNIATDTSSARFSKNGLSITPYASRLYGGALPLLYFYFEIYNLAAADSYEVHYALLNGKQELVRRLPSKIAHPAGNSSVEVGAINIGNLIEPSYQLQIEARDRSNGVSAAMKKSFFVLGSTGRAPSEVEQRLEAMSDEELKAHIEQIQYILQEDDKQMLVELESAAQKSYLAQLWKGWDTRPETPENEFWGEYSERIAYAGKNFSAGFTPGWRTDRGRIVVKFGIPNEVERFPAETNARPYEIWYYYREGRKKFIFADIEGQGRYELIFSSDERELTRPDWRLIIGAR
jgi:GWxTD domain-containing protein